MSPAEQGAASTELAAPPRILVPWTGEVLELHDAEGEQLAAFLHQAREFETQLRDAKRLVSQEVHKRMDADASWTLRAGGFTMKGKSPGSVDYDVGELQAGLGALVEDGTISQAAYDAAIQLEKPKHKVVKAGVNALLKLGGDVADVIRAAERDKDPARSVSVTPPPETAR